MHWFRQKHLQNKIAGSGHLLKARVTKHKLYWFDFAIGSQWRLLTLRTSKIILLKWTGVSYTVYGRTSIVALKNINSIVSPLEVIKSDFINRFSIVDLVGNKIWIMDFLLFCCFLRKVRCQFLNSASSWLININDFWLNINDFCFFWLMVMSDLVVSPVQ